MSPARIFRAPGRVNLIGEHTDYNLGFVLPIALNLATEVETNPGPDGLLLITSEHRQETRTFELATLVAARPQQHWSDYPVGVAKELLSLGFDLAPLHLTIRSTVPEGAGLSSSAALEVATALALLQGRELAPLDVARLCQRAESQYVGLPCGIMDQFVSVFGRLNAALLIDCQTLHAEPVELPSGAVIVAVNSMVKHQLGDSAYRTRVAECGQAAQALGVKTLREATLDAIGKTTMADKPRHRAWHIVTENDRVLRFVAAARAGDLHEMGELFIESHASMKADYEISCPEIDFLVETASGVSGCYGARMTGGGFGGCTINLVDTASVPEFQVRVAAAYRQEFGITPDFYLCKPGDGACETSIPK